MSPIAAPLRPTGKAQRRDRQALSRLWGLLYRAVRRSVRHTEQLQARLEVQNERVDRLYRHLGALRAEVTYLRGRLEDAGVIDEGEGLP